MTKSFSNLRSSMTPESQLLSQAKTKELLAELPIESTSTLNIMQLRSIAVKTFGSEPLADDWLNKFHLILGDTPIAVAKSPHGLREVEKILNAIAYGGVV